MFPRVPDQHKEGKPLVPNGLGIIYVLFTTVYLFALHFSRIAIPVGGVSAPLTLAACILFGGFMGLLDDWMDLKWRYKAFMPLIASLPLIYFAQESHLRTAIMLPFDGTIEFSTGYYFIVIPLIVMIVTNAVNMLGGLNGLESICPAVVLLGLLGISELSPQPTYTFMAIPILFWIALAALNFRGKIFVGNSGSFAIGMTIASFAIVADVKSGLLVSILPYVFNSALILLTIFFVRKKAVVAFDGKKLVSDHRRSLVTLITYKKPLTERQVVAIVTAIFAVFSILALLAALFAEVF